jgi:hypothetical protein
VASLHEPYLRIRFMVKIKTMFRILRNSILIIFSVQFLSVKNFNCGLFNNTNWLILWLHYHKIFKFRIVKFWFAIIDWKKHRIHSNLEIFTCHIWNMGKHWFTVKREKETAYSKLSNLTSWRYLPFKFRLNNVEPWVLWRKYPCTHGKTQEYHPWM